MTFGTGGSVSQEPGLPELVSRKKLVSFHRSDSRLYPPEMYFQSSKISFQEELQLEAEISGILKEEDINLAFLNRADVVFQYRVISARARAKTALLPKPHTAGRLC